VSRQTSLVAEVPNRYFGSRVTTRAELNEIAQYLNCADQPQAYIGAVEVIGAIIQDLADVEEDESSDGPEESVRQGRLCPSSRPLTRLASSETRQTRDWTR
jgi:hypothetical protein